MVQIRSGPKGSVSIVVFMWLKRADVLKSLVDSLKRNTDETGTGPMTIGEALQEARAQFMAGMEAGSQTKSR